MTLGEAIELVRIDVQQLNPKHVISERDAAEYVRGNMTPADIRVLVDDARTREAYFVILEASGDALNAALNHG